MHTYSTQNENSDNNINNLSNGNKSKKETESSEKLTNKKVIITLSRKIRSFLFIILCISNSFLNINTGVISAAVTDIKNDLNIKDHHFGLFETIKGLGCLVGTISFTFMINYVNNKYYFLVCLLFHSFSVYLFTLTKNYIYLLIIRGFSGFFCVECFLYFPLWVTKFHIQKWKTLMTTVLQITGTLGMIWGYLINLVFKSSNWRKSFILEFIIDIICFFVILLIPNNYFGKSIFSISHQEIISDKKESDGKKSIDSNFIIETNGNTDSINKSDLNMALNNTSDINSANKRKNEDKFNSKIDKKYTVYNSIICNFDLIAITLLRSIQIFIENILFCWYSDYLQSHLKIENDKIIFISFALNFVIAPLLGYSLGGFICYLIGGYNSRYVIKVILYFQLISCIFGSFLHHCSDIVLFSIFVSGHTVSNYIANSFEIGITYYKLVPKNLTGTATGIMGFINNLLGYFPSPYLFGVMKYYYGSKNSLKYIMIYPWVGFILILIVEVRRLLTTKNKNKVQKHEEILLRNVDS